MIDVAFQLPRDLNLCARIDAQKTTVSRVDEPPE
jgi:hypothetical protein